MKEAIFHPEARVEMNESFDFYEARLDGLGIRFLLAVEQTVERISTHPDAGALVGAGEFRKRIVPGFPYNIIYRVWEDYIYLVAVAHHSRRRGYLARTSQSSLTSGRERCGGPRLSPEMFGRKPATESKCGDNQMPN